jgi:hypothetical protein
MKWVTLLVLPAVSTLYVASSQIWNLPDAEKFASTIASVVLFLGVALQFSTMDYTIDHDVQETDPVASFRDFFVLPNEVYDNMKWFVQIFLPAMSALYLQMAPVWNLPFSEQVPATIMVVVMFFGTVLGISTLRYKANK